MGVFSILLSTVSLLIFTVSRSSASCDPCGGLVWVLVLWGGGGLTCSGSFGPFGFTGEWHSGWCLCMAVMLRVGFRHVGFFGGGAVGFIFIHSFISWQVLYVFYLFCVVDWQVCFVVFQGPSLVGWGVRWLVSLGWWCGFYFVGIL